MWYEWIKDWYSKGFYTKEEVKVFVKAGWITAEEYKDITGDDYVA
ncbi:XkdX family protein [Bacillus sp. AFS018417]|nr:XkdX family protein [Bacillus sp. AFS018417]PEZ05572.1 XkdX family protein [Bacillus sp. AFS018417]